MLHPLIKESIDRWVNESPEFRRVESEPLANDAWESRAIEDGDVVFEEVDLDTDEPVLRLLAAWCDQRSLEARPLAKTAGTEEALAVAASARSR